MAASPIDYTHAIKTAGGLIGAGLALGGGAVGASIGDGLAVARRSPVSPASPRPKDASRPSCS